MLDKKTLDTALDWLSKGIAVIPIRYQDKRPDAKLLPIKYGDDGKPIIENGRIKHQWECYQTQLPTEQEVIKWFSTRHNLAIVTGWQHLVVVDFDDFQIFNDWQKTRDLPLTYSVLTSRGIHCYYFLKNPINGFALPGIDIKAGGGYVLAPPSVHPSGIVYTALDPDTPILSVESLDEVLDIPKPPLPDTEWDGIDKSKVNVWYTGDLVGAIKTRYEILDFLQGVKSSGRGWFMARCPFHEDQNPSFWIDSNRGICGCFAGCTDKPMDVIDLYARLQGVSNESAIYEMGEKIGWYEEWV
jgi:hypothetical protein